ncbi:MAG: hypothetical protein DRO88_01645 [Promethearchaeia archaeon]|nr:MAG: hypothetical protein DRO88_01645 [Candidatus Lokiarchaeia archaeon]
MHNEKILASLSENLAHSIPELLAINIMERGGNLVYSYKFQDREKIMLKNLNMKDYSLFSELEPILQRIMKYNMDSPLTNAIFDTENYRIICIFIENWIFIYIVSNNAWIDKIQPFLYIATEKFYRLFTQEVGINVEIPRLGEILGAKLLNSKFNEPQQWIFKYTLIGDSGVGKTSLVNRFVDGVFPVDFRPTIGLNIMTHKYKFLQNIIQLNIYDIGSQKVFARVRKTYYIGTKAALFVFDLNDRKTFEHLPEWKAELDKFAGCEYEGLIIGNKSDLPREVSNAEAIQLANKYNMEFIETSALTNSNVEEAFVMLVFRLLTKELPKLSQY